MLDPTTLRRGLSNLAVGVFGFPLLDRYILGTTSRISREAPVLIVSEESEARALGGAGNTAANLAGLGARVWLVGPIGLDREGEVVRELCRDSGIDSAGLVRGVIAQTPTKTRVLAGGVHTTRQQMLRIDREARDGPTDEGRAQIRTAARSRLSGASAVVISDYGRGALFEVWTGIASEARNLGIPVVVDSRHALLSYRGVTAVTPNEPEAEAALGMEIRTERAAEQAALRLTEILDVEATLLTRGREGMLLAHRAGPPVHIPAVGGDAVDVTGAGDTVAATLAAALGAGFDMVTAARLSNVAASVVVHRTGTWPITLDALTWALAQSGQDG